MKNYLLTLIISICSAQLSAQTAPNINFTDLDGTTHDLYSYLNDGYTVVLDFSYEYCGPCKDWSNNVGHEIWAEHGLDGDNTIRMFHFDVYDFSDQAVASYTQAWGINYPVINLTSSTDVPEYPQEGYPTIYIICPDKSYFETGGYGFPSSEMDAQYYLASCRGADLSNNKAVVATGSPTSSTICDSPPLTFSPKIHVYNSESAVSDSATFFFMDEYPVKVFINGEYYSTQTIDPWANGSVTNLDDEAYLEPIPVSPGDEIALVIDFEGDNYPDDDTSKVTIPNNINTLSSSDTTLIISASASNEIYYDVYNAAGVPVSYGETPGQFTLSKDSCYSISFLNANVTGGSLKDVSGNILVSYEVGDFIGYQTPRLFFHVGMNTVDITEQDFSDEQLVDFYFLDLLGKRCSSIHLNDLPQGIYVQVKHYQNGQVRTEKIVKNN
ncbi:MAG: hypothetical protein ISP71_05450 [Flavobacteriales bacterium]|nr:hypothetical protein [Flavobacteriales bacterium]